MNEDDLKCPCEGRWKIDHDLLVAHLARFEEYVRAMEDRLEKLNELREQTSGFQKEYLRYDVFDARDTDIRKRVEANDLASTQRYDNLQKELELKVEANYKNHDDRIAALTTAQSRMLGMGAALITVATLAGGLIGALIGHVWK